MSDGSQVQVTVDDDGGAYVRLGPGGEVRHSVALDALEEADAIPALAALVLDFDFYGRLVGITVTDAAASVLPPAVLDAATGGAGGG
jgi:hypothetical protein